MVNMNIYCDESCHLENDKHPKMVLGAVVCPREKVREIAVRIREIKQKHGLSPRAELKWGRVSPSKLQCYSDIVDYFFDDDDLSFRAVVAEKRALRYSDFSQTHDDWYYKMYFQLLAKLLSPQQRYEIYLDIKDTRGAVRMRKLRDVLCNNMLDFDRKIVQTVQTVRSHEVEQLQLADLLAGVVGYENRRLKSSTAKVALVQRVQKRSGYRLSQTTLLGERKFNLFHWTGQTND